MSDFAPAFAIGLAIRSAESAGSHQATLPAVACHVYGSAMTSGDAPITTLPPGYQIDQMTRAEAGILDTWAAQEGWNPGLSDIDVAWACDPGAFIALRKDGALAGGGVIVAYGQDAGFMGLFIMRADLRRQGIGRLLWHERLRRLRARLRPEAPIGMDGVFDIVRSTRPAVLPTFTAICATRETPSQAHAIRPLFRSIRSPGRSWPPTMPVCRA